jgi:hypothetical protein
MEVDGTEVFVEEEDNAAVDVKFRNLNNKAKNPSSWMGSRVSEMFPTTSPQQRLPFPG